MFLAFKVDLLNIIKDKIQSSDTKNYESKMMKSAFRKLSLSKIQYYKNADIFLNKITPIQINLGLKIEPGINSQIMGAYGTLTLDDTEFKFSSIEETSSLDDLIDKLASISKSANLLGSNLYNEIYDRLECVINEIKGILDFLAQHDRTKR